MNSDNRIEQLVSEWNEVHKRGQLGFWILLAIFEKPRYAAEIIHFLDEISAGKISLQEQSLYRALRRFSSMGLIEARKEQSPASGPERKYFSLTPVGSVVLREFTIKNIKPITTTKIVKLLSAVEQGKNDG